MNQNELKKTIRKEKTDARKALTDNEIRAFSLEISNRIIKSEIYRAADTIFLYRAVNSEVCLDTLIKDAACKKKKLAYPVCIENGIMEAYLPEDERAFVKGKYGIEEPDIRRAKKLSPGDIDLVIAPCTAFDDKGRRLGMGGGYYDRYLKNCINAVKASAAYELQKTDQVPTDGFDISMDIIFTEDKEYRVK